MVTEKRLNKNYEFFLEKSEKYNVFDEEFIEKFGDLIKRSDCGYDIEGSGVHSMLLTTKYMVMQNTLLPEKVRFNEAEIVTFCFIKSILMSLPKENNVIMYALFKDGIKCSYNVYAGIMQPYGCYMTNSDSLNVMYSNANESSELELELIKQNKDNE